MNLDEPYGDTGATGVSSVTGFAGGFPYTAAVDEKMKRCTPLLIAISNRLREFAVLLR